MSLRSSVGYPVVIIQLKNWGSSPPAAAAAPLGETDTLAQTLPGAPVVTAAPARPKRCHVAVAAKSIL